MNAFLTGSQAYGAPRADSDIDMCILLDPENWMLLSTVGLKEVQKNSTSCQLSGGDDTDVALQFGRLNVLAFHDEGIFNAWKDGTDQLIREAGLRDFDNKFKTPVSRDRAKEVLQQKVDEARERRAAFQVAQHVERD